ncbi:hypothetical protein PS2_044977 [Malus domestica]
MVEGVKHKPRKERESKRISGHRDGEKEKNGERRHRGKDRDFKRDGDSSRSARDKLDRDERDCDSSRSTRDKFCDSEDERYEVEKRHRGDRESGSHRRTRDKEMEREKDKERGKRERVREKERDRDRKRRVRSDDVDEEEEEEEDVRESDRKRRRKDDKENSERLRERSNSRSDRHRDGRVESPVKKSDEDVSVRKETNPICEVVEEDLEDEQRKLDEEMEKRRRRVQEWQELRRKEKQAEGEKHVEGDVDEHKSKKTWTLEGESDDEEETGMDVDGEAYLTDKEDGAVMEVDSENQTAAPALQDDEIDPLDAFMNSAVLPEVEKLANAAEQPVVAGEKGSNNSLGRIIPGEYSDSDYGDIENDDDPLEDEDDDEFTKRVTKTKVDKLSLVDHSKIDYEPFRKNFYIEVKEVSKMTPEDVGAYRKQLELKIHGKDVPKPIKTWHQTGLTNKILEMIKKLDYEKPMPIQAQAVPIIMSGRDCIGIAKTGSGKTLAYVLPMLRHIKDQPPVVAGDGPIGLIMAPTRELVQQIHSVINKFAKTLGLRCVPVYGGSGIAQQIGELKRGAAIVVCTPGRMIDILCTNGGRITNLQRVTYLVVDEADRMFDLGFEPQINRIVQNIRPDHQTLLFSATFPHQVEVLARKVLNKPVHIQVGGKSVVNKDITQFVEVRSENERFVRLLEILGEWYERGKILVFAKAHATCDTVLRDLLRHGYPCLSLHGNKDQTDRESTISDFKSDVCNLLIATSLASRGLDVKGVELVINFDTPDHYEDYVHRVGRTGRAGKKGCAITFISEEDAKYAPDLVKALELSEQAVPDDLKSIADGFMAKIKQGLEQAHGTGYGGSGYKFNEEEDEARKAAKKAQAKEYGFEDDKSDSEDEDDGVRKAGGDISQQAALAQISAIAAASIGGTASVQTPVSAAQLLPNGGLPVSLPSVLGGATLPGTAAVLPGMGLNLVGHEGAARAAAIAAAMNLQHNLAKIQADAMPEHYEAELEINDIPQNARWKVTHKETLGPISELTGAAITIRGQYFPPGKVPGPGDRKLYLFIEGPTEQSVKRGKSELKRKLEEIMNQSLSLPSGAQQRRYQVI